MNSEGINEGSAQATAPGTESPAFFKSGAGIAVLAVVAAGVGYALLHVARSHPFTG